MSSSGSSRPSLSAFSNGLRAALNGAIVPWMLLWTTIVFAGLALASATGCTRTILVPEASPVRVGPKTKARVYVREGNEWVLGDNEVTVPEGWYLVPPSFVEE